MGFFSICIPNYNYELYITETINSILSQDFKDIEICIADNSSTDKSEEIIKDFAKEYKFIKINFNRCNVGFAENLKRAANLATSKWMILLSSDDIIYSKALKIYHDLINNIESPSESVICSTWQRIDSHSKVIKTGKINNFLFRDMIFEKDISEKINSKVYKIKANVLLKQSLKKFRNPLPFATTAYPKVLYKKIEGYSWGGVISPDKGFVYKLLSEAKYVYIIDQPLFGYRVHDMNNASIDSKNKTLKHPVDNYVLSFNIDNNILTKANITRKELVNAFLWHAIFVRVIENLSSFKGLLALRTALFGFACYPNNILSFILFLISCIFCLFYPFSASFLYIIKKIYKDPSHKNKI